MSKNQDGQAQYSIIITDAVATFLKGLNPQEQAKALRTLELLEAFGPALREPQSKPLGGKLMELRIDVRRKYFRIFYFQSKRGGYILVHAFRKQTNGTPRGEILKAERLMKELSS